ncbi:DUF456 domain-containing protein [Mechercharimyces sp. CAU 1602]|uniref:DUF456 domain-containing protein n=1 Tax=Mechercharimyces sp. CAU 1602 TaxID=2973933 RepID=UPI0021622890|nr:DUF456 family protein [Mechercharimyces sp. CAU 1602]MCS1351202.1 DUF456 family protein [Mechercharimyces sp. CAU 1602]
MDIFWWFVIAVLFVLAFAGLFLPVLPDSPLVLVAFIVYHFAIDQTQLGIGFWIIASILTVLIIVIDYAASAVAARTTGGSRTAMWSALAGAIIAPFLLGPLGLIVGPFVAVFLVELYKRRSWQEALKVGGSTLVGFLGGVFMKGILMFGMIGWFFLLIWI